MSQQGAGVLFVCMGNICRSPTAEGVFRHLLAERRQMDRFKVDSAGTHGYHIGRPPDRRAVRAGGGGGVGKGGPRGPARRGGGESI
jgi:protein-tyrosine phosphatase